MGSHLISKIQNEENEWKIGQNIPKNKEFLFTKLNFLLISIH